MAENEVVVDLNDELALENIESELVFEENNLVKENVVEVESLPVEVSESTPVSLLIEEVCEAPNPTEVNQEPKKKGRPKKVKAVEVEEVVEPMSITMTGCAQETLSVDDREIVLVQGRVLSELPFPSNPNSCRNDGFGYAPGQAKSLWDIRVIRGMRGRRNANAVMRRLNIR